MESSPQDTDVNWQLFILSRGTFCLSYTMSSTMSGVADDIQMIFQENICADKCRSASRPMSKVKEME